MMTHPPPDDGFKKTAEMASGEQRQMASTLERVGHHVHEGCAVVVIVVMVIVVSWS